MLSPRELEALRRRCALHVSGHAPEIPGAELARDRPTLARDLAACPERLAALLKARAAP